MGLRIIGRRPKAVPVEVSEADLLAGLVRETTAWPATRDYQSAEVQRRFMEKFRSVKARFTSPADAEACAVRIRERLQEVQLEGTGAHAQVDVATLLELL